MRARSASAVAAELGREIASLQPGARVASEHEVMSRFAVGRSVARAALGELENRYLVRRVQGAGTFVLDRVDYVISGARMPSLHQTVRDAGGHARTFLVGGARLPAPELLAGRLAVPPGAELLRLDRVSYINGVEAGYLEEWVPPGVAEDADVGLHVIESLTEVLRGHGHEPYRAWCRVSLEVPPPVAASRLGLEGVQHSWFVESVLRDRRSEQALLLSRVWHRLDALRIVVEIDG